MAKSVMLLLIENVDNLGIVGDVVSVKIGYARNYLLPHGLATEPSDDMVAALQEKRKEAEKMLSALRSKRQGMMSKLDGLEITLERPCNDQGILYASVTQQDIAAALTSLGFEVKPREVRLGQTVKRVDTYEIQIKFDADHEAAVKLWVVADRKLDEDEREEMEFDNEGNLVEKPAKRERKPEPAKAE